jgi:hypothetical protein
MRRLIVTSALLTMALLPVAAAVSAEPANPTTDVPVAIAQPLVSVNPFGGDTPMIPESGLLVLVGSGLMGLASIVRKTTKI